jgi:hypothetical protein
MTSVQSPQVSPGMARKNWRRRKTNNAEPNRFPAHSGTCVLARPSRFH